VVDKTIDYGIGGSMPDKPSAPEVRIQALGTGTTQNVPGILSLLFSEVTVCKYKVIFSFCFFPLNFVDFVGSY
jgi:hypothetical protein